MASYPAVAGPALLGGSEHEAARRGLRRRRALAFWATWSAILVNVGAVVWLWASGGNVTRVDSTADLLISLGRLAGLLAALAALLQVVLLARIPWLERHAGFDRLTWLHRVNGFFCVALVVAHVALVVWGYALVDRLGLLDELWTMLAAGFYPGMVTAALGTALFVLVAASSVVVARRRLPYEAWYAVHLAAYAAIALAWFHQVPNGNELLHGGLAATYWAALYLGTLGLVIVFRVGVPLVHALRYRLRVESVTPEGEGVWSLRIVGRGLERMGAQAGQFFRFRFLNRRGWWQSHPFSLSEAPDGRSLRITVRDLGDFTHRLGETTPGTRVWAQGPYGALTATVRRREKTLLIGGGIGIAPIRALAEQMDGDVLVLYRVLSERDAVLREELAALAERRGIRVEIVAGDHGSREGRHLLDAEHLGALVPDLAEREVFVCGPSGLVEALLPTLRMVGVPRRLVHVERFAI